MKIVRTGLIVLTLLAAAAMLIAPATAHATHYSPDGKIKFVYGHLDEPAYTYTKTGLDLSIIDNETGIGISGLGTDAREDDGAAPKIWVNIRYGGAGGEMKNISDDFRAQHGQVGKYTHPIIYTRPGLYSVVITGTINGTEFNNFVLAPAHPIEAQEDIMWPAANGTDNTAARVQNVEKRVEVLEREANSADAPSLGPLVLLAAVLAIALAMRRR